MFEKHHNNTEDKWGEKLGKRKKKNPRTVSPKELKEDIKETRRVEKRERQLHLMMMNVQVLDRARSDADPGHFSLCCLLH